MCLLPRLPLRNRSLGAAFSQTFVVGTNTNNLFEFVGVANHHKHHKNLVACHKRSKWELTAILKIIELVYTVLNIY